MPSPGARLLLLLPSGPDDLPTPAEGAGTARRRAEEILARDEFRRPGKSLLQRAWDWFGERLAELLGGAGSGNAVLAWTVALVLLILVALVALLVVRRIQRDPLVAGGVRVDDVGRPAADWRAEAARHEAAGAHREAVRCHWRALVADLAAGGLVEEVPGRTTGEYRRRIARAVPTAAEPFSDATGLFEVAWYATGDVAASDVADERRLGERVLAEARR